MKWHGTCYCIDTVPSTSMCAQLKMCESECWLAFILLSKTGQSPDTSNQLKVTKTIIQ